MHLPLEHSCLQRHLSGMGGRDGLLRNRTVYVCVCALTAAHAVTVLENWQYFLVCYCVLVAATGGTASEQL